MYAQNSATQKNLACCFRSTPASTRSGSGSCSGCGLSCHLSCRQSWAPAFTSASGLYRLGLRGGRSWTAPLPSTALCSSDTFRFACCFHRWINSWSTPAGPLHLLLRWFATAFELAIAFSCFLLGAASHLVHCFLMLDEMWVQNDLI